MRKSFSSLMVSEGSVDGQIDLSHFVNGDRTWLKELKEKMIWAPHGRWATKNDKKKKNTTMSSYRCILKTLISLHLALLTNNLIIKPQDDNQCLDFLTCGRYKSVFPITKRPIHSSKCKDLNAFLSEIFKYKVFLKTNYQIFLNITINKRYCWI